MAGQPGFFDLSDRYEALSAAGDPLERLAAVVDFEVFRSPLIMALRRNVRSKGGRPPFDPVLMFKILVLQALYSLSDEAGKSTAWALSCAPSASPAPPSRSVWPTFSIISSASPGSRGVLRLLDAKAALQRHRRHRNYPKNTLPHPANPGSAVSAAVTPSKSDSFSRRPAFSCNAGAAYARIAFAALPIPFHI